MTRACLRIGVILGVVLTTSSCADSFTPIGTSGTVPVDPIDVLCTVQTKGEVLAVRLSFTNVSEQPVLVKKGIEGFGVRENKMDQPGEIHADEYVIESEGRRMAYVGFTDYVIGDSGRAEFAPVLPREIIDVRFNRLDDAYVFMPGTHEYVLHHVHLQWDEKAGQVKAHRSRPVRFTYSKVSQSGEASHSAGR